jgi:multisubunit Na+/H+ antiporter MnhB subunit
MAAAAAALFYWHFDFALGVMAGGLIVTINFHLLARTLKSSLTPPHLASHQRIIAKYYLRFITSGVIIFFLISGNFVDPLGLFVGLSVVVASIFAATALELTKLIFKEAV